MSKQESKSVVTAALDHGLVVRPVVHPRGLSHLRPPLATRNPPSSMKDSLYENDNLAKVYSWEQFRSSDSSVSLSRTGRTPSDSFKDQLTYFSIFLPVEGSKWWLDSLSRSGGGKVSRVGVLNG